MKTNTSVVAASLLTLILAAPSLSFAQEGSPSKVCHSVHVITGQYDRPWGGGIVTEGTASLVLPDGTVTDALDG